ncbi:MAG: DUF368 domain-containing protein [Chloroflexi bacterium]|nr:DUF368 domain-containing protein [Chloroflexota bacterium]
MVARGFAMGSADVVPGVSGGTMAFILGIYEELVQSIKEVAAPDFLKAVFSLKIREALQIINWQFLVAVASGILLAIITLAPSLEWLLENQKVYLMAFFFGLVLASTIVVAQRIERWGVDRIGLMALGAVGAFLIVGLVPAQTPDTWWFLLLAGSVAICAMILPGISGAFILLLLGKYQTVLAAVGDRDIITLGLVAIGAGFGIVTFAQLLGWLFKHYHDLTIAFLTGLMIGSLRKIWPWKEVLETTIVDGEELILREMNILPALGPEVFIALGLGAAAFVLVIVLEQLASRGQTNSEQAEPAAAK